jgi:hypothetical protein
VANESGPRDSRTTGLRDRGGSPKSEGRRSKSEGGRTGLRAPKAPLEVGALQTLARGSKVAKRLECVRLTAAFRQVPESSPSLTAAFVKASANARRLSLICL